MMGELHDRVAKATAFDWDEGDATKNWTRHAVTQVECEQPFFNDPLLLVGNDAHSGREPRSFALGHTDDGRLLLIVFTIRGSSIRVISARPISRREREVFRNGQTPEEGG